MKFIAVYTTVASHEEAGNMARVLVEKKLAACAQLSEIESFYDWQGSVQNEREWQVIFKTTAARYADVEQAIRDLHSYELPAIYALAVTDLFAPYGAWVEAGATGDPDAGAGAD